MKFVDRKEELKALKKRLRSRSFELIIIYGRRRVGKTRLALEAVKGLEHIYYLAVEGDNLDGFRRVASATVPEIAHAREDWGSYFNFLKDRIVIIDEFPNLMKEDSSIPSIFQRIVDVLLKGTRTKLILLGSSVSMMSDRVLSVKSPLYGRRTSSLRLHPLKFFDLRGFFPRSSWEELVEIYGFADGLPYYLEKVKPPFWRWLGKELARPDTFLKDEMDFLMKYEFTEVSTYKKILEAVAMGRNTPKEIRDFIRASHSDITPYIANLIETGFLMREVPVTEGPKSKKGRYYIADNFSAFWFRYIHPNLSAIEARIFDLDRLKEDYPAYLGHVFEKVGRQFLVELIKRGSLSFSKVGRWWHRGEEIDLVALDDVGKRALLVEVKWGKLDERGVRRELGELKRKAEGMKPRGYELRYGILAKKVERTEGAYTWDFRDFDALLAC